MIHVSHHPHNTGNAPINNFSTTFEIYTSMTYIQRWEETNQQSLPTLGIHTISSPQWEYTQQQKLPNNRNTHINNILKTAGVHIKHFLHNYGKTHTNNLPLAMQIHTPTISSQQQDYAHKQNLPNSASTHTDNLFTTAPGRVAF